MIRSGQQTGYILLPVIVVITLVAAIALLMNTESALESNTAGSELDSQQARYVAEAGLNHGLWMAGQQGCSGYTDLTDVVLGNDKYSTVLTTDLGATSAFTITVDQDSWIEAGDPTKNNGTEDNLRIQFQGGDQTRPIYRYDLSALPAKATILSATAWFYVTKEYPAGPVDIHRITADWTEADATWNLLGDRMDSVILATIPTQSTKDVWVSVSLTSQVQAWVNGEANYGIAMNTTYQDTNHGIYNSREATEVPYLEVVVGTPPTSPAILKSAGTLQNGVSRAISRNDVVLYQHPPGVRQLQPDAVGGEDAEIWEQSPNNNYGDEDETWVSSDASDTTRSLLRFNVGAIPVGAKILQASLSLERESGAGADQPVSAHRIVNSWSEGSVTWNERKSGTNWDSAGADFDNTAVATTPVGPANQRYAWNITPLVQGWVDGSYPNHGVALVAAVPGMPGERFYTSDDADPSRWPSLSISYACACGVACVAPQGAGRIVMIGNYVGIYPDPRDQEKEDIIESWGYDVDIFDDNFIWSIDFNNYDLVYISETTSSTAVMGQLNWRSISIVNEQGNLNFDLGFATAKATQVGKAVDIVDNSHYITAPFALGPLSIYSADMEIITGSGSIGPDLQTLAEAGAVESLMLLDTGATGVNGPVPGKRVDLPLGRVTNSNFNWTYLNNNGRLLVQRAIRWGIGEKKIVTNELIILSTAGGATLGGLSFTDKDLAEYDRGADTATLYLNGGALSLAQDIDAVHVLANGHLVLSAINTITLGGITSENEDLIDYDPVADSADLMFDGSALFTSGSTDISAVHVLDNGHLLLTNEYTATLGGQSFGPNDIIDYDPETDTAILFFDGDAVGFSGWINAVHLLDSGNIVLSTDANATLGGLNFTPDDLVEYDPLADSATLFLNGALFSADENIRSVHIGPGSGGPAVVGPFNVLFVVGNVGGPGMTAEETAHQTLIESWGHTVEIIDDGALQTDFDTAVANNDVVFTTNDITASTLGIKLVNTTIGVVTSEDNLSDEFGLASAIAWESGTQLEINDNTHYITSPFATGILPILTASESLAYVTGTLSPDLGLLASSTSGYGIVTLETGYSMDPSGTAAGRRVQLPWGGSGFDPNHFNDDGRLILKRALEWGAGLGPVGPIAHWKLDDAAGSTAIDSAGGNDATLNGNPDWTTGVADGALEFDGSGDYATTDSNFTPPPVGTVSFWMKVPGSPASHGRILGLDDTWEVRHVTTGTPDGIPYGLVFDLGVSGVNTDFVTTITVDTPDQWYFVAATYDTNTDDYAVYLNGVLQKSGTYPSALAVPADNPLSLGTRTGSTNYFDGTLDDVRVYDYALSAGQIADLYAANPPPASASYTELYQNWSASSSNTWQTVDLSVYGVPANAVVEVALENDRGDREREAGVRAVGSGLGRSFDLHEAENGGMDAVVLHVQTDASSQIQHFAENTGDITFRLLGYWTGAAYVDLQGFFTAGSSGSWQTHSLTPYGVTPGQVVEVVMQNTDGSSEFLAGARKTGSTIQRRFDLHESESGGKDYLSLFVEASSDAAATIQVYAENNGEIEFKVVGAWTTPPGSYTETGGAHGQVSSPTTWETIDLTSFGVPANSVAQFVMANERDGQENQMGVRATGSTINNRRHDLQEAEQGGSDLGSMHVNVDASAQVQWAAEYGATEGYFYPVGWWVLSP